MNGKYTTTQGNLKLTNYQNGAVSDFDVTPSGWTRLSEGVYELAFTTSFADSIAVITNSDYIQLLYEGESGAGSVSWKNNMLVKGEYTLAQLQALGYVSYEPVTLLSCQNNAQTSTVRDRIYGQGDKIWLEHNVQTVSGFKYGDPEIDTTDLVTNGDMEAGLATVNGQSFTGFQTTRTQSTDEAHAGSNSFKNVLTGSAGNTYVIPNNSALNGKKVRKTGWVYIPSANTSLVEVEIRARIDGSDSILDTITTLDAWTYFDVSYVRGSTPATDRDFIFNSGTATSGDIFYFDDIEEYQFNIQENLAPTLEDITEFCNGSLGQPADQGQNHIVAEGGVELGIVHYLGVGAVTKDLSEALQTKANKTDVPVPRFLSVTRENASAGTGNLVYQFSDMAGFADYYENIDGQGYTLGTNVSDIILFPNAVVFVKSAGVASGEFLGSVTVSSAEAPYFYTGD